MNDGESGRVDRLSTIFGAWAAKFEAGFSSSEFYVQSEPLRDPLEVRKAVLVHCAVDFRQGFKWGSLQSYQDVYGATARLLPAADVEALEALKKEVFSFTVENVKQPANLAKGAEWIGWGRQLSDEEVRLRNEFTELVAKLVLRIRS